MNKKQEAFNPAKIFEDMADIPMIATIRKWIETYSPIEDVTGISFHTEPLELLFNKDGERLPKEGEFLTHYAASPLTQVAITLKDGSVHSAGWLPTGELYKIKSKEQNDQL